MQFHHKLHDDLKLSFISQQRFMQTKQSWWTFTKYIWISYVHDEIFWNICLNSICLLMVLHHIKVISNEYDFLWFFIIKSHTHLIDTLLLCQIVNENPNTASKYKTVRQFFWMNFLLCHYLVNLSDDETTNFTNKMTL